MPSARANILIVSESRGDASTALIDGLRHAGLRPTVAPDVYTAMADLARRPENRQVIVDVRHLDETELAFIGLAPRYFPTVDMMAPLLPGAAERIAAAAPGLRAATIEGILRWIGIEPAHPPERPAPPAGDRISRTTGAEIASGRGGEPISDLGDEGDFRDWQNGLPLPATTPTLSTPVRPVQLSTDGLIESTPGGPALHEAVRMRMTGDDPRIVRRRPPTKASPDPPGDAAGPVPIVQPLLREEIDALLAVENGDARPTAPLRVNGGTSAGGPA